MAKWLGIDITDTTVRVALLSAGYRKVTLETLREERLGDHETPSAALRAATAGLKFDACATAVDGRRAFLRKLDLPAAAHKELANVLSFEVEATLPVELDDAVMDHKRLTFIAGVDPAGTMPILAGVAYTEEVRALLGLIRRGTGMEPLRVGLGSLGLCNLAQVVPALRQTEPVALLVLEERHADFIVLRGGEVRFSRSLSRGVAGLPAEAGTLSRELRQTLAAWRASGGAEPAALTVVGAGRYTPGMDHFIHAELGLHLTDLPRPDIEGVDASNDLQLGRYAKALGLALSLSGRSSDLDLRQGPLEAQQSYQFLRDKTPLMAGLAAAVAVSFGFSMFAEMRALDAERQSLEERLGLATKVHFGEPTTNPKKAASLLDQAISGKSVDVIPEVDAFDVMVELSKRVPPSITHDVAELDYNRGSVSLKGIVSTIDEAHVIAKALAEHPCFKDVNIARTTKLKTEDKQKYTLELNVSCAPQTGKKKGKGAPKPPTKGGSL